MSVKLPRRVGLPWGKLWIKGNPHPDPLNLSLNVMELLKGQHKSTLPQLSDFGRIWVEKP